MIGKDWIPGVPTESGWFYLDVQYPPVTGGYPLNRRVIERQWDGVPRDHVDGALILAHRPKGDSE